MALPIVVYGDPVLRRKAALIEEITPEIEQLASDMIDTMMKANNGVGLAAPQVGRSLRLFVLRDEILDDSGDYVFSSPEVVINPVFSNPSKKMETALEGCLSLPKIEVEVARPSNIHVRYQTLKGEFVEEDLKDFRARVFMHENDHLNGTLIIDRISSNERNRLDPFLRKIKIKR